MKKIDSGAAHKIMALVLVVWIIFFWLLLMQVMKAGLVKRYIEDCLAQANLSAILVDPYYYGSAGELVFEDINHTRALFLETLQDSLGGQSDMEALGISEVKLLDFRVYEVTANGTREYIFGESEAYLQTGYEAGTAVRAPDHTLIEHSAVYAKIEVPIEFMLGIKVMAVKEHCVDIVSEE